MASGDLISADNVKGDTYHFHIHTKEASVQLGDKNILFQTPEGVLNTINELKKEVQDLTRSNLSTRLQLSLLKRNIDRVDVDVTVNRNAKRPKKSKGDDCHTEGTDEEWENGAEDGDGNYECGNYSNEEWEEGDGDCNYSNDEDDDGDNVFSPDLIDFGEYAGYEEPNNDDGGDDEYNDDDDDDEEEESDDKEEGDEENGEVKEKTEDYGYEDMVGNIYSDFDDDDSDCEISGAIAGRGLHSPVNQWL